jgi:hypothetical protein
MRALLFFILSSIAITASAQPWTADGICDLTDGGQWNNGGATGCACTWLTFGIDFDTITNCAYGDCGQNALYECVYDCNGHNGWATNSIERQCDATADPICWFNGNGSQGEAFCLGLILLPVIFFEAEGYHTGGSNIIKWSTHSEYNSSHYIIERADSSMRFEYIATIPSNGTTSTESKYRFIDMIPFNGLNYYKISQYDYDGEGQSLTMVYIDNRPKVVVRTVNTLGQKVDGSYNGLVIKMFSDGTSVMEMR